MRLQEDVERRIAKEEALSTGAYFDKSALEIGMDVEDKQFEEWRVWAIKQAEALKHQQASTYTSFDQDTPTEIDLEDSDAASAAEEPDQNSNPVL